MPGVWLIEPVVLQDERGVFRRLFCADEFAAHGLVPTVVQGNFSGNPQQGTLRGFHYQTGAAAEAKTISCLAGALYDIVADLRPESPTFMQWISTTISAADSRSLHVPAGCANAWLTTEPDTLVHYYMSEAYSPQSYSGFRYNDPAFRFQWPSEPRLISDKDLGFPDFDPASVQRG